MTTAVRQSVRLPRPLLEDQLAFLAMCWIGVLVLIGVVLALVTRFSEVSRSAVEVAAGIVPWYPAIMGGYLMFTFFPMFIAHGRTRRDAAIEVGITVAVVAVTASILTVVTYQLEWILFRAAGWPTALVDEHLYDGRSDIGLMLLQHLLQGVVWGAAGSLVGASIYRWKNEGYFSLLPASLGIVAAGMFFGGTGPLEELINLNNSSAPLAAIVCIVVAITLGTLTWQVLRNMPTRSLQA